MRVKRSKARRQAQTAAARKAKATRRTELAADPFVLLDGESIESLAFKGVGRGVVEALFPAIRGYAFEQQYRRGKALHAVVVARACFEAGIVRKTSSVLLELAKRLDIEQGELEDPEAVRAELRRFFQASSARAARKQPEEPEPAPSTTA